MAKYTYNQKTGTYTLPSYMEYLSPEEYRRIKNLHKKRKREQGGSFFPLMLFVLFLLFIFNSLFIV